MVFKQGNIPWSKGKHLSEGLRHKISQANKNTWASEGLICWTKGKPLTKRHKHNLSEAAKAVMSHNGRWLKLSEEEARKIFEAYKSSQLSMKSFARTLKADHISLCELFNRFFPDEYDNFIEAKMSLKTPMYARGRAFEYKVRNYFISQGYFVLRSPRSKGPVDLIAIKKGDILLIQCKLGQNYLSAKQRIPLINLAESLGATPLLAFREQHKIKTLDLRGEAQST